MCLDLNNPYTINSIGIAFDIFGAWLVAWEVVHQYRGVKFKKVGATECGGIAEDPQTCEYKKYEKSKNMFMLFGVALLTIGFCLQIYSNILQSNGGFTTTLPAIEMKPQIRLEIKNPPKNAAAVIESGPKLKNNPVKPTANNVKQSVE